MSNTVFILGAGASKQAGAPLMKEFLDTAHNLWRLKAVGDAAPSFELVFDAVSALQAVHSKSQLDLDNIESVFTTCEMAKMLGRFPGDAGKDIDGLIRALKVVIIKTLELTMRFPISERKIMCPEPYDKFVHLVRHLKETAKPAQKVTLLTFNYDIALDFALFDFGYEPDYGLGQRPQVDYEFITLLKLHGSLNWSETIPSVEEKAVIPWSLREYFKTYSVPSFSELKYCHIPIGSQLAKRVSPPGTPIIGEALLVPPTWNKAETHRTLSLVWQKAAAALSEAENIFVIGYSMPEADAFFRYLYALGTVGKTMLKRFWVFDPDASGGVERRFAALLGPGASVRFRYHQTDFADALSIIQIAFPDKR